VQDHNRLCGDKKGPNLQLSLVLKNSLKAFNPKTDRDRFCALLGFVGTGVIILIFYMLPDAPLCPPDPEPSCDPCPGCVVSYVR
jgi:hypothetical protein